MDAIRDEAAQQLLSERLRFASTEVAAQGELGDMNTALAEARNTNNGMELRISELMVAGREVTDSRDSLLGEFRSARNNLQSESAQMSELQRQVRALGQSSEDVRILREELSSMSSELARAQEINSGRNRQLASEEALVATLSRDLQSERVSLERERRELSRVADGGSLTRRMDSAGSLFNAGASNALFQGENFQMAATPSLSGSRLPPQATQGYPACSGGSDGRVVQPWSQ
eukprot:48704-Amphidinium_carterae.1